MTKGLGQIRVYGQEGHIRSYRTSKWDNLLVG